MRRTLAGVVLVAGLAVPARAQDHASCPMAGSVDHRAAVDHRHEEATGVAHAGTVHHFLLAKDGGAIVLEIDDPDNLEERGRIRDHLQTVARSMAAGDFSLPTSIHGRIPPGVGVMKKRRSAIQYAFAPSDNGGVVRISTRDTKALEAVHEFLRFQIQDHGTNDPAE